MIIFQLFIHVKQSVRSNTIRIKDDTNTGTCILVLGEHFQLQSVRATLLFMFVLCEFLRGIVREGSVRGFYTDITRRLKDLNDAYPCANNQKWKSRPHMVALHCPGDDVFRGYFQSD